MVFETGERRDTESERRRVGGLKRDPGGKRRRRIMCNECVPLPELL